MGRIHIERASRPQAEVPRVKKDEPIAKVGHLGDLIVKNGTERARRQSSVNLGAYALRSRGAWQPNTYLNNPNLAHDLTIRSGSGTSLTQGWSQCQVVCRSGSVWSTPNEDSDINNLTGASHSYRVLGGYCTRAVYGNNIGDLSLSEFQALCSEYARTHPAPPPTTEAPTTQPPTTVTTEPPTTQPPPTTPLLVTTEAPTTQAPTTVTTEATTQPTTLPPTTEATTQATTLPPTTVTTEAPTTVTTQAPTTQATTVTTEPPTTLPPTTEAPTTQAPTEPPTEPIEPSSSYAPSSTVAQSLAYFSSEIPTEVYQKIVSTTQAYLSSQTSSPVVSSTTGFAATSAHPGPAATPDAIALTTGATGITVVAGNSGGGVDGAAIGFSFLGVGAAVAILVSGIVGTTRVIKAYLSYREAKELKEPTLPVRYTSIPNS